MTVDPTELERFVEEVAEIAAAEPASVTPESRLVDDLDFDSLAFAELAVLMMERHRSGNFLAAVSEEVDVRALTVRSVFENYARPPRRDGEPAEA